MSIWLDNCKFLFHIFPLDKSDFYSPNKAFPLNKQQFPPRRILSTLSFETDFHLKAHFPPWRNIFTLMTNFSPLINKNFTLIKTKFLYLITICFISPSWNFFPTPNQMLNNSFMKIGTCFIVLGKRNNFETTERHTLPPLTTVYISMWLI